MPKKIYKSDNSDKEEQEKEQNNNTANQYELWQKKLLDKQYENEKERDKKREVERNRFAALELERTKKRKNVFEDAWNAKNVNKSMVNVPPASTASSRKPSKWISQIVPMVPFPACSTRDQMDKMLFFMDKNDDEAYFSEMNNVLWNMNKRQLKCRYEMLKKEEIHKKEEYKVYMEQVRTRIGAFLEEQKRDREKEAHVDVLDNDEELEEDHKKEAEFDVLDNDEKENQDEEKESDVDELDNDEEEKEAHEEEAEVEVIEIEEVEVIEIEDEEKEDVEVIIID